MKKSKLLLISAAVGAAMYVPTSLAESSQDKKIEVLERKVSMLQSQQNAMALADKVTVSGFATIAAGIANNESGFAGYNDEQLNFKQDSVIGVQADFKVNNSTSATMQMVSRGADEWDLDLKWAFLAHEFDNGLVFKGGKMPIPVYLISDFIEVGYAYPFLRPALDIYGTGVPESYTGLDLSYAFDFDEFVLNTQVYYGHDKIVIPNISENEIQDLIGIKVGVEWESFTVGFSKAQTVIADLNMGTGAKDYDGGFTGVNFMFDDGSWLIAAEYTKVVLDDVLPDLRSTYLMASYNFGTVTPYIAWSTLESTDDHERSLDAVHAKFPAGTPKFPRHALDTQRTTISVGTRFELASNVALKLDWTKAGNIGDTSGNFPANKGIYTIPVINQSYNANIGSIKDTSIYSIAIDVIF